MTFFSSPEMLDQSKAPPVAQGVAHFGDQECWEKLDHQIQHTHSAVLIYLIFLIYILKIGNKMIKRQSKQISGELFNITPQGKNRTERGKRKPRP